jgi:hypothetical protein
MPSLWTFYTPFVVTAAFLLSISIRMLIKRRPVVLSGYWLTVPLTIGISPMILLSLGGILRGDFDDRAIYAVTGAMFLALVAMVWYQNRGYVVLGVTGESVGGALRSALQHNNIEYRESISRFELAQIRAEVRVSLQWWMGIANLRITPREQRRLLRSLANGMGSYFKEETGKLNIATSLLYGILGSLMIALVSYALKAA